MASRPPLAPRLWGLLTVAGVVATPLIGVLAGTFASGGVATSTREYFLPAGYAFSIWAVIYLGLIALGAFFALPRGARDPRVQRAAPWIAASALANAVWIVFANQLALVPWTVPTLVLMEVTAWIGALRLFPLHEARSGVRRWLGVPLRIYLGWLSVATVANSAAALNAIGWSGWGTGPIAWTLVMIVAAVLVAWIVGALVDDDVYRSVFVWAFVGIAVEQWSVPVVAWAALVAAFAVLAIIVAGRLGDRPAPAGAAA